MNKEEFALPCAFENEKMPDTFDLYSRAMLAMHGMSGILDREADYEFYWYPCYKSKVPTMEKDSRSFAACGPKILDAFFMMKRITGTDRYDEAMKGLSNLLLSWIDEDGLFYIHVGENRPWDITCREDYVNAYGQSRMILAVMTLYQYTDDESWLKILKKMGDALCRIAIDCGDYAYYPAAMSGGNREGYCYLRYSGWDDIKETVNEQEGTEGSMFMYHCGPIRALTKLYQITKDDTYIKMAEKFVHYVMRKEYWGSESAWPKTFIPESDRKVMYCKVAGSEKGHFIGHFHGHTAMLFALIEYAIAVKNTHIMEFVRFSYEYCRTQGIARIGLFGETCTISDLVAIAIRLSQEGIGDYWDDADAYLRNQLAEQQYTDAKAMKKAAPHFPQRKISENPRISFADNDIFNRTLGIFIASADINQGAMDSLQCCTGNGAQAYYFVWESMIAEKGRHTTIHLLLNRVAKSVNIRSYIPYEGKVEIKNKTATSVSVRIPSWADIQSLTCTVNGEAANSFASGRYVVFIDLYGDENLEINFHLIEDKAKFTVISRQPWTTDDRIEKNPPCTAFEHECFFKGSTLITSLPRPDNHYNPMYTDRQRYVTGKPKYKLARYPVSDKVIQW